uniref:Coatomer subunit zeta n=1 Tax=Polytomella parva TaxID=51329 RepID=A0A7S0UUI0_9CHLO|mmetsp:Transcript_22615/g.40068  ORF Transcript_22615/g.40068 Transcript_22615/m.40068 type:complete len:150 (+) Transcript_22615:104-553(+)
MDFGRIHCFIATTKFGEVLYERFYDRLTEQEKADIRCSFKFASSNVRLKDGQDLVGTYKLARFVFVPYNDVQFFMMGSGEYDELALSDSIKVIIKTFSEMLGKGFTSDVLLDKYHRLCLVVDEVVNEGLLENTEIEAIKKGIKSKGVWE